MKFKRSIVLLLVLAMLLIPACGKEKTKDNDKKKTPVPTETEEFVLEPESNKIVGWIWGTSEDDIRINSFIRKYSEYDFEVDNSTSTGGVWGDKSVVLPNLSAAIATDEQPDLFQSWIKPVEAYYSNLFMPIDRYITKDPEYNVKDIDPLALDSLTFNDQIYFAPIEYSAYIFSWHRDLFKNAGLDSDKPPETWTEFYEYCEKTTAYNPNGSLKTIGTDLTYFRWDSWHIAATGEHFVDRTGLNFAWDTKEYVRTFEYIRDLQKTYGGQEKLGSNLWWFMGHNISMAIWSGNSLHPVTKDWDIGISKIPAPDDVEEEYLASNVDAFLGIPKDAKNPSGAWMLLKHALTDGQIEWEISNFNDNPVGYISTYITHKPTREKLYDAFEELISEELMERMKKRDDLLANVNRSYYYTPVHNDLNDFFMDNYVKMLNHELAPQDFVNDLQEFSEAAIKDFIKTKEAEGWTFPEGKDGIPPEGN